MRNGRRRWLCMVVIPVIVCALCLAGFHEAPCTEAADGDWPLFRRSNTRDASSGLQLPLPLVKRAVFSIDTPTNASPVVADGRLFLGGEDNALHCIDSATGRALWTYMTGGAVRGSAAVDGDKVFVGSDDGWMYCLNVSAGTLLWKFRTGSRVESSPAVSDTMVYFGSFDGNVYAVAQEDGSQAWSFATGGQVVAAPALYQSRLFAGSEDGVEYCLDASTGSKVWSRRLSNRLLNVQDWLYANSAIDPASSSVAVASYNHSLYVIGPLTDGSGMWTAGDLGGSAYCGPVILNNALLQAWDHGVTCWDSSTGTVAWTYRTDSEFRSAPVVAEGYAFIMEASGQITAFEVATGKAAWWYTVDDDPGRCTPIIAGKSVYFTTSSGHIYVFGSTEAVAAPLLSVQPLSLDFGSMEAGQNASQFITISNVKMDPVSGAASGRLQGTASVDVPWVELPVSVITRNEQSFEVRTDTHGLVPGRSYSGHVSIVTNGGTASVPIVLTIKPLPAVVVRMVVGSRTAVIGDSVVTLDQAPLVVQGRTLVPVRFISEALGAVLTWDAVTKTIDIVRNDRHVILRVGALSASIDGRSVLLDVAPSIVGGRTLVPVRFISEALGAAVSWNGSTQEITLTFAP